MKIKHLEILDLMESSTPVDIKNSWISKVSQRDLYEIASWLMMYLTPQSLGIEHERSRIRDLLSYYYTRREQLDPWTDRQKFYVGYSVINLWPYRQLEMDPRYCY